MGSDIEHQLVVLVDEAIAAGAEAPLSLAGLTLDDQHGTTHSLSAGTRTVVFTNGMDASKIVVASSAVIDEANLMSIESTHLGAAPSSEVGLLLMSTDDERASYVSTSFQPEAMSVDGSDEDWNGGNALNPSGYAMPGVMSGDGTDDLRSCWC